MYSPAASAVGTASIVMVETSGGGPDRAPPLLEPPLEQPVRMAAGMSAARQKASPLMSRMIPSLRYFRRVEAVINRWPICQDMAGNVRSRGGAVHATPPPVPLAG